MLHQRKIYCNADRQWITDVNGYKVKVNPSFVVGDNLLLKFIIKDDDGNPVNLTGGLTFKAGFDYSFATGHTDLAVSNDDQFNIPTDWTDLNASQGKICCRMSCGLNNFETYMSDSSNIKTGYFDLWAIPTTGVPILLTQFKVDLKNPIYNPFNYDVGGLGSMMIGSTFRVN